jgi:lactam utilization protein B
MMITDLTRLKQRNDETIARFVQMFREVRNKCYSLKLGDKQLVELALQGLLPTLREKYASHDFESLSQLVSRMSQETAKSMSPGGISRRRCFMWIALTQKIRRI